MTIPTLRKTRGDSIDRLYRLNKWMRILVAFFLFISLAGLFNKVVEDLGHLERPAALRTYYSPSARATEQGIRDSELRRGQAERDLGSTTGELAGVRRQINSLTGSVATLGYTRSVTEDVRNNDKVVREVDQLVPLRAQERQLLAEVTRREAALRQLNVELEQARSRLDAEAAPARAQYAHDRHVYVLKTAGLRLGLTLPILLSGAFVFARYRTHKYAPLVWGYVAFAAYAFFVVLVPYLPSFGGYVRYGVGVALAVAGGVYATRWLSEYLEAKRLALAVSREQRAQQVSAESAILAYRDHTCPSCGQDYTLAGAQPKHCFHCGIALFKQCDCGHVNFAFFPYCSSCGTKVAVK